MEFSKITNVSLTDLFVQQAENMILSGAIKVGERLPPARELSAQMGVSRPVISAGLVELEKLGFVEIRPRQGAFVSDYRRKGTVETLMAIMRYNGGAMRDNEVTSLLQVRWALERLCVELIVQFPSREELEGLAPLLEAIAAAPSPERCAQAVFDFHHELAVLSGNMLLPLLYHSFRTESTYLWTISCRRTGCEELYAVKKRLYQALLDKDLERAQMITDQSIEAAMNQQSEFVPR